MRARSHGAARRSGVRWDRVGRALLLLGVIGVLALYVNPITAYYDTWQEAKTKRAEVADLRAENERLKERRADLRDPLLLEQEARKLGMVQAGERPFVIDGLPD